MEKYKILLNGQDMVLKTDGGLKKHGFYTTRFIEAESGDDAIEFVKQNIIKELNNELNYQLKDLSLIVEEISCVDSFDPNFKNKGFTFYEE